MRRSAALLHAETARSPWVVLGFDKPAAGGQRPLFATKREVAQRYRELVKVHHPDAGGCEDAFRAVKAAFELVKNGGRIVLAPSPQGRFDDGADEDGAGADEHSAVRNAYREFWQDKKTATRAADLADLRRQSAFMYASSVAPTSVTARNLRLNMYSSGFSDYMKRITLSPHSTIKPGILLCSRVAPDLELSMEYNELNDPIGKDRYLSSLSPETQGPAAVLVLNQEGHRSTGVLLNRGDYGGPLECSVELHDDGSAPGRQRLFRGLYRGGTPREGAAVLRRHGVCMWDTSDLPREVSAGLWSVHDHLRGTALLNVGDSLKELPDAPRALPKHDVTDQPQDVLQGMQELGVFSCIPWK
ncbi:hypothetical protein DIPPA_29389 [Diplonema papillatum]|nr:hypothetical protein DIPPA_29389 [Diplonema papillatum]